MTLSRPAALRGTAIGWTGIAQVVCLVGLTCLCYWPSLGGGFLWDDDLCVTHSPLNRSLEGLRQIWFSTVPYDYFPVTYTAFWVEWHLWGADPLGYRAVNLALHLTSAGLLWRLLTVLRAPGAWLGTLFFAIHPVNVASVAWIAELKNALSMVFYLGALIACVRSDEEVASGPRHRWYGAALGCFVLAVLCKSSVVMLPCVLLLFAWWRRGRIGSADLVRSAPFFLVSLLAGLATMWFQRHRAMDIHVAGTIDAFPVRLLAIPHVALFYIGKAFVPVHLSMIYPRWSPSPFSPAAFFRLLAVVVLPLVVWKLRTRHGRGLPAALGYFLLSVLPVAGWAPTTFLTYSYVSDHYVYVAQIGLLVALAAVLTVWRARPGWGHTAAAAAVLLVGWFAVTCYGRAGAFASSERLWSATLAVNPRCAAAHNNLGLALEERQRWADAEIHFRAALDLDPHLSAALSNEAGLLQHEGRWREAAHVYEAAVVQLPDPRDYNNYGVVCLHLDETARARELFERAEAMEPSMPSAHFNLYKIALAQNDPVAAASELAKLRQVATAR